MSLSPLPSLGHLRMALHHALRGWQSGTLPSDSLLPALWLVRQMQSTHPLPLLAVRQVIADALNILAEMHPDKVALLRERFMQGVYVKEIVRSDEQKQLTEDAVQHQQRRALLALAHLILAQESHARQQSQQTQLAALDLPTYKDLFGVAHHRVALQGYLLSDNAPWLITISGLGA